MHVMRQSQRWLKMLIMHSPLSLGRQMPQTLSRPSGRHSVVVVVVVVMEAKPKPAVGTVGSGPLWAR
jgi:hypothetical protein